MTRRAQERQTAGLDRAQPCRRAHRCRIYPGAISFSHACTSIALAWVSPRPSALNSAARLDHRTRGVGKPAVSCCRADSVRELCGWTPSLSGDGRLEETP